MRPPVDTQNPLFLRDGSPLSTFSNTFIGPPVAPPEAAVPLACDTMTVADESKEPRVRRTRNFIDYIEVPTLPGGVRKDDYARPAATSDDTSIVRVTRTQPGHGQAVPYVGRNTGAASGTRGAAPLRSCHQCKSRRHEAKMRCAGEKRFRGKPCELMYCKQCVNKQ